MIAVSQVKNIIEANLPDPALFVVEINVSAKNHITVDVDSPQGVTINDCLAVSRALEANLDREVEDYSLEVASPGLDKPLRIVAQYLKNIGRDVIVVTNEGNEITGQLTSANENLFEVTTQEKVKLEGKKKKELVTTVHSFTYEQVKSTHIIITFK